MNSHHDGVEINSTYIASLLSSHSDTEGLVSLKSVYDPSDKSAKGRWDLFNYKDIGVAGIKDMRVNSNCFTHSNLESLISMEVMLQGGSDMRLGEVELQNNDMPRLIVSSHMERSRQSRFHRTEEVYKGVGFWLDPEKLVNYFGLKPSDYPKSVAELLSVKCNRSLLFPITNSIKKIVEEIICNEFVGVIKKNYLEAKLTELLCHIFVCLKTPENAFNQNNQLSSAKAKAMKNMLAALDENLRKPPSLDELATEIGMSKSLMTKTFKNSYGLNVSEYITQKRLTFALELIHEGKLSILQIALEVGYRDQSSFGRAFKKFFGYSPLNSIK